MTLPVHLFFQSQATEELALIQRSAIDLEPALLPGRFQPCFGVYGEI